jgi:CubicO group peptidase (beta-lactamase class C family)
MPIRFVDLATHTSGLPSAPANLHPADPLNPWGDYSVDDLYAFLNGYALRDAPGTRFVYSNIGEGLLGLALALRDKTAYADGVRARIAKPLGLVDTTYELSPSQQARLAPGYDGDQNVIEAWSFTEATAGAGELLSTVNDLLKYAAAQAGIIDSPLRGVMALSQKPIHTIDAQGDMIGLNWIISPGNIVWHNGAAYGAGAFVGFDPDKHKAVVLLTDTCGLGTPTAVWSDLPSTIGLLLVRWLQGRAPSDLDALLPKTISLGTEELSPFVGTYTFSGALPPLQVTLGGGVLKASSPWLWPYPVTLYPSSTNSFVLRVLPGTLAFDRASDGDISGVRVSAAPGQTVHGTRQ